MNMMFVVFIIAMWQAQLELLNVLQPHVFPLPTHDA